ncbi:zinc-binding dehydrogenase [Brevibacillus fulvus]|uniref:zinc-binding dehydrogenase n=1 Tax=Brevibacillus fulvus TaxID=1125967 RepID=UPI0033765783
MIVQPGQSELNQIAEWVQDKKLKLQINRLFPLTERGLIEAHTLIETKHTNGKLVVQIK